MRQMTTWLRSLRRSESQRVVRRGMPLLAALADVRLIVVAFANGRDGGGRLNAKISTLLSAASIPADRWRDAAVAYDALAGKPRTLLERLGRAGASEPACMPLTTLRRPRYRAAWLGGTLLFGGRLACLGWGLAVQSRGTIPLSEWNYRFHKPKRNEEEIQVDKRVGA